MRFLLSIMNMQSANTFLSHNRLPNPYLVVMTILYFFPYGFIIIFPFLRNKWNSVVTMLIICDVLCEVIFFEMRQLATLLGIFFPKESQVYHSVLGLCVLFACFIYFFILFILLFALIYLYFIFIFILYIIMMLWVLLLFESKLYTRAWAKT